MLIVISVNKTKFHRHNTSAKFDNQPIASATLELWPFLDTKDGKIAMSAFYYGHNTSNIFNSHQHRPIEST